MIKVEKGIPVPNKKFRMEKYPFTIMNVGDSFVVSYNEGLILQQCVSHFHKRQTVLEDKSRKRFTTRKQLENGKFVCRCWRTE